MHKSTPGLFITGTDTDVGKTVVACLIARALVGKGHRVGVYKPAASGCSRKGATLVCDDACQLWAAAGQPGELHDVCPQMFEAALAPHLAAREEGRTIDRQQLRQGVEAWRRSSDLVIVEGAGGLMSPISDTDLVADLAWEFGYPLVVVSRNTLGTINHTLLTLLAAASLRGGLSVAGIVLNETKRRPRDASRRLNRSELMRWCQAPLLAELRYAAASFDSEIDWYQLATNAMAITR